MNRLYFLLLLILGFQITTAQQFNVHFSNPEVDNEGAPSELCVQLEISYTATATLGTSNFLFEYDEAVLTNPTIAQSYLNSDYDVSAVVTSSLNAPSLGDVADVRVVYDFINGTSELTLVGQADCSVTTSIAQICFDVSNASAITDLSWIYDGDGSSTATNVNTHISSPNVFATQLDANATTSGNCSLTDITIDIPNTPETGGGSCATNLIYSTPTYSDPTTVTAGVYQVSNNIETTPSVSVNIEAGATVVFDAGNAVILRAGFTAANGTTFTAKIGGCTPALLPNQNDLLVEENNDPNFVAQQMQLKVIPNPVYDRAAIRFFSPEEMYVSIKIFDLNGKVVEHLHQQFAMKGWNHTEFYPKNLSSGVYLVSVQTKDSITTERLIVQGEGE